uniref:Uncharacterized protein n=1 Tax=Anguilla anguilla TaxID=7936 RepID=A0A0E9WIN3_ANGAN
MRRKQNKEKKQKTYSFTLLYVAITIATTTTFPKLDTFMVNLFFVVNTAKIKDIY